MLSLVRMYVCIYINVTRMKNSLLVILKNTIP